MLKNKINNYTINIENKFNFNENKKKNSKYFSLG